MAEEVPQPKASSEPGKKPAEASESTLWDNINLAYAFVEEIKRRGLPPKPDPRKAVRDFAKAGGIYPIPNVAVDSCVSVWTDIMKEKIKEKGLTKQEITDCGRLAYCSALPKLSTRKDVTDFIACVAHGMAINIIPAADGTRLLYAAQVSQTSFPPRKQRKKTRKSALKPDLNACNEHPMPTPTPPETAA
jgi:hypothetical protein